MNITSQGIVDINGCQHSKPISISVFQTEHFPKWVKKFKRISDVKTEYVLA